MRQETLQETLAIADYIRHGDFKGGHHQPAFTSFDEILDFVESLGVHQASWMSFDEPENRLGVHWIDIHSKEDFDKTIHALSAEPRMRNPREYGIPYDPYRYNYAFFIHILGGRPINSLSLDYYKKIVLVRGNINRRLKDLSV